MRESGRVAVCRRPRLRSRLVTISIACSTGDHMPACDGTVVINNEVWPCSCSCHSEATQ